MGGASTRVSNVVKGLVENGSEASVVCAFPHYPHGNVSKKCRRMAMVHERFKGVDVFRVWIPSLPHNSMLKRFFLHVCFIFSSLFALPFVGKVDVVWAANPNLFSIVPAVIYGFVKQRPIVRNVDDLWPEVFYELGVIRSPMFKRIMDLFALFSYIIPAAITPISLGYKRHIVRRYGIPGNKVYVVEVGTELKKTPVPPSTLDKKSRFTVMYSGVLGVGYDFEIILQTANILSMAKDVVFVIRGVGELAATLKTRIERLDLQNVILNASLLPKDKLSVYHRSADIFVLPMAAARYVEEGLPAKVFEYQSYSKPIICISSGESASYVSATKSGLVVKPGDIGGFAEAVLRLHDDCILANVLGANGHKYVTENLTVKRIGERMLEVFQSVIR